ncbi:hypothetical protein CDL12_05208 [Handroanthus impetiginosus]|uniref:Uncharacterized protein n=1 Tax=Handroanthus impetiginosus TaxID=429701 RepID=A0A2G9HX69_9LAMI|nr:hypothetical protein CDL12_05208 [Handroanthus impetiginosus]
MFMQVVEMVHRGPSGPSHHPMESLPLPVLLENKLASQEAELEELARDNRTLASSDFNLRQDLVAAQQKIDELREHIRSIQTEADIQTHIFSNKIAKAEADIRAGDIIKKELQKAHIEAQRLVTAKLELAARIEQATKELDSSRADVNKLPEMHAELDSLRQEHQRLRKTFEYEKGLNIEKVEQMKILEKNLVGVAGEVESLRAELLNAEKRASVPIPNSDPYRNSVNLYPPSVHGNAGYSDSFGRPHLHRVGRGLVEGMNPFASGGFAVSPPVIYDPALNVGAGGVAGGAPVIHDPAVSAGAVGVAVGAPVISGPAGATGVGGGGGVAVGAAVISDPVVTAGAGAGIAGNPA